MQTFHALRSIQRREILVLVSYRGRAGSKEEVESELGFDGWLYFEQIRGQNLAFQERE